ncbi:hypothetical protein [Neobacillus massiliamazoniensis]|nr:hypothetical protein [Neobacillus massiliamazoniensis]
MFPICGKPAPLIPNTLTRQGLGGKRNRRKNVTRTSNTGTGGVQGVGGDQ